MTISERNNKLKHFINCLKCEVSGKTCDVNCSTQYDAGNMGEIIENLEAISKVLNQQPCEEYNYKALWEQVKWERDVATEQLEQLGYSLGEKIRTSEDCISRQALIEKATSWDKHFADSERAVSLTDIMSMPSVTPQPKRGHWTTHYDRWGDEVTTISHYKCSECGQFDYDMDDFCPSCGADMREVQNGE